MQHWTYHDDDSYQASKGAVSVKAFDYEQTDFYASDFEKAQVEHMLKAYQHNRERDSYRAFTSFFGGYTRSQKFMAVDKLKRLLQGKSCELTQTDLDCLKQGRLFRDIGGFTQLAGVIKGLQPGHYRAGLDADTPVNEGQRLGG